MAKKLTHSVRVSIPELGKEIRYGRGKFTHHDNYIDYQTMIANHPNYSKMPGAFTADGKPFWQVSSGKTTSFYHFYEARRDWWTAKADELGLPGVGQENDRWTIAARKIHPEGYRDCLICGEKKNVGYFYLNAPVANRLNKNFKKLIVQPLQPIGNVLAILATELKPPQLKKLLSSMFPERQNYFLKFRYTVTAFEKSNYLRTHWLSPGFMGNPPYRFDGLHDYCTACRKSNDPGRSDENMQSYNHDRRAFEWWAEGNWALADALYNSAGPGFCNLCSPPKPLKKVSPDHIGPLACGFKHHPYFRPTCTFHNSSKQARMRVQDVKDLITYELSTGESPASWHVRPLWDHLKGSVYTSKQAVELSAIMRAMQDLYLRCLFGLFESGHVRFLRTLLHPEYALWTYTFTDLNTSELTFTGVRESGTDNKSRRSLRARTVRIAFAELVNYVKKEVPERRIRQIFSVQHPEVVAAIVAEANKDNSEIIDKKWAAAVGEAQSNPDICEEKIAKLLQKESPSAIETEFDRRLKDFMLAQFEQLASNVTL